MVANENAIVQSINRSQCSEIYRESYIAVFENSLNVEQGLDLDYWSWGVAKHS